jgi:hypothetical protein
MNRKVKLGITLFLIGFIGILSTLTMDLVFPEKIQIVIDKMFTPWEFKLISLINPTILLLIFVISGTIIYDKVNFKLPIIESIISKEKVPDKNEILKYGIIGGVISGILMTLISVIFIPFLPIEFIEIGEKFKPGIITKFLYGGLTEEILIRFGLMSLITWIVFKITRKLNPIIYWAGIIISAIAFGFGHLPIVYTLIGTPTTELLLYIILGNSVGGIIFGWIYWKKGLESAMIAHIFAHILMILGESIF